MSAVRIRRARLPDDKPAMIAFIDGLQAFEHQFEPDRRVDARAGADYLPVILDRVKRQDGRIFIAERLDDKTPVGWAVFHTLENMVYVRSEERRYGYIAELFLIEEARGKGIGRSLMAMCEDAARELRLRTIMIGVLSGNARARHVYEEGGFRPYALELRKYL